MRNEEADRHDGDDHERPPAHPSQGLSRSGCQQSPRLRPFAHGWLRKASTGMAPDA